MKEKVFKTLDEQIEILERKNIKIPDVEYAKQIILHEADKKRHLGIDLQEYVDDLE